MDFSPTAKRVFDRIQKLEPEDGRKIIGWFLLGDLDEQVLVRLAEAPEHLIHRVIHKAKTELQSLPTRLVSSPISPPSFTPFSPVSSRPFSSPPTFRPSSAYWDPQLVTNSTSDFLPVGFSDSPLDLQNQTHFSSLEDQMEPLNSGISGLSTDYYYPDAAAMGNLNARTANGRYSSLSEFPVKTCHYFNKGFCKHGSSCRYFHGQVIPESFSQVYGNDGINDDYLFLPGSLEKLEIEIIELLKSRRGNPVSIASLPAMYYEKYGKSLQAEGYLTESQRHGKAGYSLTKLLARLKNSIRMIDRYMF